MSKKYSKTPFAERVARFLEKHPSANPKDISNALGTTVGYVYNVVKEARRINETKLNKEQMPGGVEKEAPKAEAPKAEAPKAEASEAGAEISGIAFVEGLISVVPNNAVVRDYLRRSTIEFLKSGTAAHLQMASLLMDQLVYFDAMVRVAPENHTSA
jgi:hypothetical protein